MEPADEPARSFPLDDAVALRGRLLQLGLHDGDQRLERYGDATCAASFAVFIAWPPSKAVPTTTAASACGSHLPLATLR